MAHIEHRQRIIEIVIEWENAPDLVYIFQDMPVAIFNRAGSYSGISHPQRVTMSFCLNLTLHKTASNPQRAIEDGSRKRKREPQSAQMEAERDHLFDKNDEAMRHLFRDCAAHCPKCLF